MNLNRRQFLKQLGVIGASLVLPIGAIRSVTEAKGPQATMPFEIGHYESFRFIETHTDVYPVIIMSSGSFYYNNNANNLRRKMSNNGNTGFIEKKYYKNDKIKSTLVYHARY